MRRVSTEQIFIKFHFSYIIHIYELFIFGLRDIRLSLTINIIFITYLQATVVFIEEIPVEYIQPINFSSKIAITIKKNQYKFQNITT